MTSRPTYTGLDPSDALATADALAGEGKRLEAIDLLQRLNREARNAGIERRLVRLRHDACAERSRANPLRHAHNLTSGEIPYGSVEDIR